MLHHNQRQTPAALPPGQYILSAPSPQNALDIFQGEWSSAFPEPLAHLDAGKSELFRDDRVRWFAETIGGVQDKRVLELGPLEGGHTYMLEQLGASEVVAVESNARAYLKCLITREVLGLRRARFLCGDFLEYLRTASAGTFDVCLACGVLYHMQNPAELIDLLSRHCSRHLCIWTHYYDKAIISSKESLAKQFGRATRHEYQGFSHTLHRYEYQAALNWAGFCGGNAPTSNWMSREDIVRCLEHFGFEVHAVSFEEPDHQYGPALALVARRLERPADHSATPL